jgi:hypothetical protein
MSELNLKPGAGHGSAGGPEPGPGAACLWAAAAKGPGAMTPAGRLTVTWQPRTVPVTVTQPESGPLPGRRA